MGSAAAEFGSAVAESEGLKSSSNVKVNINDVVVSFVDCVCIADN